MLQAQPSDQQGIKRLFIAILLPQYILKPLTYIVHLKQHKLKCTTKSLNFKLLLKLLISPNFFKTLQRYNKKRLHTNIKQNIFHKI